MPEKAEVKNSFNCCVFLGALNTVEEQFEDCQLVPAQKDQLISLKCIS